MLRRRIHDILARKLPKWMLEDRTGPLDWSILPLEMKLEIVKYADFKTRACLRQCSKYDQKIVDSIKTCIPFVSIETDQNYVSVIVCESKARVLRVVLNKKKIRLGRKKTVLHISDNINGDNCQEFYKNREFDVILESLMKAISRINITIDTLNLELKYPHDPLTKYLDITYRALFGPARKTKIICSGMEFLSAQVYFLPIHEVRIISDLVTNWQTGRLMLAGKSYDLFPTGHLADIGKTQFWKLSLLDIQLGALISGILSRMSGEMEHYNLLGMEVSETEVEELRVRFEGRVTTQNNVTVLQVPEGALLERKLIVKISKCGVSVQKARMDEVVDIPRDKCLFDWMCSKCDKSVESWYFRTTNGIKEIED